MKVNDFFENNQNLKLAEYLAHHSMNDHWLAGRAQYEMYEQVKSEVMDTTTIDKYVDRDETCEEKVEVDIVLVVDEFSSINDHFDNVKSFVKYMVNKYTMDAKGYNVGLVRFADTVNVEAGLGKYTKSSDL